MTQNELVRFRKDAGMSQEEVGDAVGKSRDTVRRWERMEVEIPASAIPILAKLYKRSREEILAAIENPSPAPAAGAKKQKPRPVMRNKRKVA